MRRLKSIILSILLIVVTPVMYLWILNTVFVPRGLRLIPVWEDNTFLTEPQEPIWVDSNFTEWSVNWEFGQKDGDYGFIVQDGVCDLYATFKGRNYTSGTDFSGVSIKKSIADVDTREYPYLHITHKENSSDYALMFSISIVDNEGQCYSSEGVHASKDWIDLEYDLRKIYNGTINQIHIQLTNEYNSHYAGGMQHAYIKSIGIYKRKPMWTLSYDKSINAGISNEGNTLKVFGRGNLTVGTIVVAQRFYNLTFKPSVARYINVSIRASSIAAAARIVLWTSPSQFITVLLKTYNDENWHTEIIDMLRFGISDSQLYLVELGWLQVYNSTDSSTAWYRQLSFNQLKQVAY